MTDRPEDWESSADRLAAASLAEGDATGWFDKLYAAGASGETQMPWNRDAPHWLLAEWTSGREFDGGRALVVGCGLGADAEHLSQLGLETTAFDVSATAVRMARERHPDTGVDYRNADLFALPDAWRQAFDLVVEIFTVQALPRRLRRQAIDAVTETVAPGGTLFVGAFAADEEPSEDGPPPWPLTRSEIDAFSAEHLRAAEIKLVPHPENSYPRFWRGLFTG